MPSTITYGFTPRNFTTAVIKHNESTVLEIQASSAIDMSNEPSGCLKYGMGDVLPGSSNLWLHINGPTAGKVSAQLSREEVGALAGILLRWLTTGFVEAERAVNPKRGDEG